MINKVIIACRVADLKVVWHADGQPSTSFTLRYEEAYGQGQTANRFMPVDVALSQAEHAAEVIEDGALVLINGRLKWKTWVDKKGERQGKLGVMAWVVSVLTTAMVESAN